LPTTEEPTPPTLTIDFESAEPLSAVRPKRAVALRQQRDDASAKKPKVTSDEGGATIVSVESNMSVVAKSRTSKNENKRKNTETPQNRVTVSKESRQSQTVESDRSGDESYGSPILRSHISSAKADTPSTKRFPQQRVSLSPMIPPVKFEGVSIPVFDGCDHDKLVSCLNALKPSNCANLPTICSPHGTTAKKSKFASNILKVSHFIQALHMSRGQNGTGKINEDSSAALYVCGAPGLGKTSGVYWCCDQVAKSTFESEVKIKVCHVNASYLTAQSTPLRLVMKEIATCMGIKTPYPSESTITKRLSDTKNSAVLLVVVDEVDAFVAGGGRATNGSDCLQTVLQWANNPAMQMGLIGISNCMNDDKFSDIRELGTVSAVIFSYCLC
jgi:Cdc6-like AAA superfamily ATPase